MEEASMEAPNNSPVLAWIHRVTPRRLSTYTAYSIGCAIAWALLWAILATTADKETLRRVLLVFLGWCIGWLSATIARAVYPPPKKRLLGPQS
jgi:hypothetical protein